MEAAARSRNQRVSSEPSTPAAGVWWRSTPGAWAAATASDFSSPLTRNQTEREWLRAGKVSEIRSGGGLGESVTPTAI